MNLIGRNQQIHKQYSFNNIPLSSKEYVCDGYFFFLFINLLIYILFVLFCFVFVFFLPFFVFVLFCLFFFFFFFLFFFFGGGGHVGYQYKLSFTRIQRFYFYPAPRIGEELTAAEPFRLNTTWIFRSSENNTICLLISISLQPLIDTKNAFKLT